MVLTNPVRRSAPKRRQRTTQRALVAICCICLTVATAGTATAHTPVEPTTMSIEPAAPRVDNRVQITLAGVWSDACVPQYRAHQLVTDTMPTHTLAITVATPVATVCGQVVTDWSVTVEMGQLPYGQYDVGLSGAVHESYSFQVRELQIFLPTVAR